MSRLRLTAIFFLFAGSGFLAEALPAQQRGESYLFSNKDGQQVSAVLLGVSEDRQKMDIRREDGRVYNLQINLLSLDDQQYVKDWLKAGPAVAPVKTDYRLDVEAARVYGETRNRNMGSYLLEEKDQYFRVKIRNLSRDTLEGAKLEYAYVWRDEVLIFQTPDQNWTFSTTGSERESQVKKTGEIDLEPLRFNGEVSVETAPLNIDRALINGDPYRYDDFIGILVRVVAADGTVIEEKQSGTSAMNSLDWEDILALPDPRAIQ